MSTLLDLLSTDQHTAHVMPESTKSAVNSQQSKPELDECEYVAPDSPIIPLQSHSNDTQPIMVSTSPAKTVSDVRISNLNLYLKDLQILRSNGWLNDGIMCACQSIIRDLTKGKTLGWQSPV